MNQFCSTAAPAPSDAGVHRNRQRFHFIFWLLAAGVITLTAAGKAFSAPANRSAIVCQEMTRTTSSDGSKTAMGAKEFSGALAFGSSLILPNSSTWTPGLEVARERASFQIMCHEYMRGTNPRTPVYMKIVPSQDYLNSLREANIDVEIETVSGGFRHSVKLLEEKVSLMGLKFALPNIPIVMWEKSESRYDPTYEYNERDIPWVSVNMRYTLRESEQDKKYGNSRHQVKFPDGYGLAIKIFAADFESTGLAIRPTSRPPTIQFGTCAAPSVSINGTGQNSAVIDFGDIPIDLFQSDNAAPITKSFTVSLQPPPNVSPLCESTKTAPPRLRFLPAAGDFLRGRFVGDRDTGPLANDLVALEIRDDMTNQVVGSGILGKTRAPYLTFDADNRLRSFTASLFQISLYSPRNFGPFLIPVLLEAYYP